LAKYPTFSATVHRRGNGRPASGEQVVDLLALIRRKS
jgi:hypothetical protein